MTDNIADLDIYEVANQLQGYVGPSTSEPLAKWLMREGDAAARLADEIVRLRAALEAAEVERDRLRTLVEQAFRDGMAYGTNVIITDPDEAWRTSRARAALGETK